MRSTAESETFSGLEVETEVLFGDATRALLNLTDQRDIDIIVMGSHGRGAWGRMMLGSVSQRIIREARVPVVIVPPNLARAEES